MPDVFLVTCEALPEMTPDDRRLLRALHDLDVDARPAVWSDDDVDWSSAGVCIIRNTWDYYERYPEFVRWLNTLDVPVHNPIETIRWNAEKTYLRDLHNDGLPIIDTIWVDRHETIDVGRALDEREWPAFVIKPTVGGSAYRAHRGVRAGAALAQDHLAVVTTDAGAMIQPFVESVLTVGELSLIYFNGEYSHTVRKMPQAGDFRVQDEYGGSIDAVEPDADARAIGDACAAHSTTLLSRVDLVRAADGTWRIIELELIEPALYLEWGGDAAHRLAGAIAQCVPEKDDRR